MRVTIQPPGLRRAPPEPPPVPASVQEKIDAARKSGKPVRVPATLSSSHWIIANWVQDDRRARRESRYDPWLRDLHERIDGTPLDKRRLRILSALFKALEAHGYKLISEESHRRPVQIVLGDERLEIELQERIQQVRRQLTEEDRAKDRYFRGQKWIQEKVPTGELLLRLKEPSRYGLMKEWRETSESPLETKLDDVLAQIAGLFEELRLRRERETEEQARRWKIEEERRRNEMERKRETIRYRRLLGHCKTWRTAAEIRAFVAAVEASPLAAANAERFETWKSWALGHAERIDPLQSDELFDQAVSDYEVYMLRD